jgi:hypothetical protein
MSWLRLHKDEPEYFVIKMGDHPLELPPKRRDWHLKASPSWRDLIASDRRTDGARHLANHESQRTLVSTMKHLTDRALVGWRILLILLFFNMLVCAYSGRVGWLLFWAIAFSSYAHEYGYEYGKTKARISSQIPCQTDL